MTGMLRLRVDCSTVDILFDYYGVYLLVEPISAIIVFVKAFELDCSVESLEFLLKAKLVKIARETTFSWDKIAFLAKKQFATILILMESKILRL